MRVLITGAQGKMGALTKSILEKELLITAVYGFDLNEQLSNHIYSDFSMVPEIDVIIDFSTPKIIHQILAFSSQNKYPLVIATTGYSELELKSISEHAKSNPVFMSANYAFGVAVISEILKRYSHILETDFDIEIIEKHHHHKVDAPSGTSLHLANTINQSISKPKEIKNGHTGKRDSNDLSIHAMRGGSIVGEHQVIFAGTDETIEITHIAQSKSIFVYGALRAAQFILNKEPGLYNMNDLLKERI